VQSQQLPTESQILEGEVLPGMESADQPTEEMPERHDHGKNCSGKIRIELCAKSFILQVYDVLARHRQAEYIFSALVDLRRQADAAQQLLIARIGTEAVKCRIHFEE
jgi:hypothetical protein